jgi:hypothetical protein
MFMVCDFILLVKTWLVDMGNGGSGRSSAPDVCRGGINRWCHDNGHMHGLAGVPEKMARGGICDTSYQGTFCHKVGYDAGRQERELHKMHQRIEEDAGLHDPYCERAVSRASLALNGHGQTTQTRMAKNNR